MVIGAWGLIAWELAIAHHVVFVTRPNGKNGGKKSGVDEIDSGEVEHDPTHRNHLGDGADFAAPVRFDRDVLVDQIKDTDSSDDFEIPNHHKNDEPDRKVPIDSPIHKGGRDKAGHEKGLVGERIEDGPGERLLIEMPRDPAIDPIEDRGQGVGGDRQPAK